MKKLKICFWPTLPDTFSSVPNWFLFVFAACPQTLTNLTGSFSTPNYPSNYDNDIDCSWTIKVPEGYVITLRFTDFKVENTILCAFSCVCDYIELHDLTVNGVERNHGRFCMWNPPPKSFVSTSNQLRITFHSDFNHADKGFRAVYTSSFKGKFYCFVKINFLFVFYLLFI